MGVAYRVETYVPRMDRNTRDPATPGPSASSPSARAIWRPRTTRRKPRTARTVRMPNPRMYPVTQDTMYLGVWVAMTSGTDVEYRAETFTNQNGSPVNSQSCTNITGRARNPARRVHAARGGAGPLRRRARTDAASSATAAVTSTTNVSSTGKRRDKQSQRSDVVARTPRGDRRPATAQPRRAQATAYARDRSMRSGAKAISATVTKAAAPRPATRRARTADAESRGRMRRWWPKRGPASRERRRRGSRRRPSRRALAWREESPSRWRPVMVRVEAGRMRRCRTRRRQLGMGG